MATSQAKKKFKNLKYESFFGWTQEYSLRSITVDARKFSEKKNKTEKYVNSILRNILSPDQSKNLIEHSRLKIRIENLKNLTDPLLEGRDKRFAHLDNKEVENVTCNLQDLFYALANLYNSLDYIAHFSQNSQYIIDGKWDYFNVKDDANPEKPLCFLDRYFKDDPTLQEFATMLQELNETAPA